MANPDAALSPPDMPAGRYPSISLRLRPDEYVRVERFRAALEARNPGMRVTLSAAAKALLAQGLELAERSASAPKPRTKR